MMWKVFLFCGFFGVLISANPLYQVLPVQSCSCPESNYQHNTFKAIPKDVYNDVHPTNMMYTNPVPQNSKSWLPIIKDLITGNFNPNLNIIQDPNTRMYTESGIEVPRKNNFNSNPSVGVAPNIVNNYYLVPPEYIGFQIDQDKKKKRDRHDSEKRNDQGKRKKKKDKNSQDSNKNVNVEPTKQRNNRNSTKGRSEPIENTNKGQPRNTHGDKDASLVTGTTQNNYVDNGKQKPVQNNIKSRSSTPNHSPQNISKPDINTVPAKTKKQTPSTNNQNANTKQTRRPKEGRNDNANSRRQQTSKQNRESTYYVDPRDEYILRDFRSKFPDIPEEVARSMLSSFKAQMGQPNGLNSFYPTMNYPYSPPQYYNTGGQDNTRKRNKSKSKSRNKNKESRKSTLDEIDSDVINPIKNSISNNAGNKVNGSESEKSQKSNLNKVGSEPIVNQSNQVDNKTQNAETTAVIPLQYADDWIPTFSEEDLNDDYYPDFSDLSLKMYDSNEEVVNIYDHKNDRHDTVRKGKKIEANNGKEKDSNPIQNNDVEKSKINSQVSSEVLFQTPPLLESPDFVTKKLDSPQVNPQEELSYFYKPEVYEDDATKTSSYSDAKTPLYSNVRVKPSSEIVRYKISSTDKPKLDNVETVYATSKVATYGQTAENDQDMIGNIDDELFEEIIENINSNNDVNDFANWQ